MSERQAVLVCPKNHVHARVKDEAGFDTYGFLIVNGYPCRWNRFRVVVAK